MLDSATGGIWSWMDRSNAQGTDEDHTRSLGADRQFSPSPLILRKSASFLLLVCLPFHGPLTSVQAGWDVPIEEDLDVLRVVSHLIDQFFQEDADAWSWVAPEPKAEDDAVNVLCLVQLVQGCLASQPWGD